MKSYFEGFALLGLVFASLQACAAPQDGSNSSYNDYQLGG